MRVFLFGGKIEGYEKQEWAMRVLGLYYTHFTTFDSDTKWIYSKIINDRSHVLISLRWELTYILQNQILCNLLR